MGTSEIIVDAVAGGEPPRAVALRLVEDPWPRPRGRRSARSKRGPCGDSSSRQPRRGAKVRGQKPSRRLAQACPAARGPPGRTPADRERRRSCMAHPASRLASSGESGRAASTAWLAARLRRLRSRATATAELQELKGHVGHALEGPHRRPASAVIAADRRSRSPAASSTRPTRGAGRPGLRPPRTRLRVTTARRLGLSTILGWEGSDSLPTSSCVWGARRACAPRARTA